MNNRQADGLNLDQLTHIAEAIVQTVGSHCEVVIHDITHIESSVVAIVGNVTHRRVGSGPTDLLLEKLRNQEYEDLVNYRTITEAGQILRSSSIFLRDTTGTVVGVLCINIDMSAFVALDRLIRPLVMTDPGVANISESFAEDVEETVRVLVAEAAAEIGKPLNELNQLDRAYLTAMLDQQGVFQIKRAVPLVAALLGVSRFTIYTYLQKARRRDSTLGSHTPGSTLQL